MRDYSDLVDSVVSVLEHWYRGSLDECHKAGTPTLNPREYISNDSEFLDKLISNRLDSDENARCVLVTHLLNPWGVLNGYSPDFDGVSGITRFRNDCVKAFYKRANYIYEHDGR